MTSDPTANQQQISSSVVDEPAEMERLRARVAELEGEVERLAGDYVALLRRLAATRREACPLGGAEKNEKNAK